MTLALPDPQVVALAEVRNTVVPRAQELRAYFRDTADISGAREMARQLAAFRSYLRDREGRDLIEAEQRRTEVLIGQLLGPGEPTAGPGRGKPSIVNDGLSRGERLQFRRLADHETLVEQMLAAGRVTRKAILDAIQHPHNGNISIPEGVYSTITADPPWQYGNTSTRGAAQTHYDTLTIPQLCGDELLPDGQNLAKDVIAPRLADRAHLYLWTTAGHLPDAFSVLEAWGFTYKTYLVWVKPQMGMGNYFRVSTELVLFGVKGDMRTNDMATVNWFQAKRGKHSSKPLKFYDLVTKSSPGPYLELFGRCDAGNQLAGTCQCARCRLNWQVWGNQT